jgi:predicted SnoaL-like aldol condensation-catalyzing enzyme
VIELVNPNDPRAVRNKNNVLALYDLMINKKDAEQAVAKFFAPKYVQHNPHVPDGGAELARLFGNAHFH